MRGNGRQLAQYLMRKADNDNVRLLAINGTAHPDNIHASLQEMSLTAELTKSTKGLYHVQICPAYNDIITDDDWKRLADILAEETGFSGQKRAMVVHEKNGKAHLHLVIERYDHMNQRMLSDSFNRLAQDRARVRMEKELNLERTPERNTRRPEMKEFLLKKWMECDTIEQFLSITSKKGYQIASGTQRPYIVIDERGRSFDLVRQLHGVRTKEVRQRLKGIKLPTEKSAIKNVRNKQAQQKMDEAQQAMVSKIKVDERLERSRVELVKDNKQRNKQPFSMTSSFKITGESAEKSNAHLEATLKKHEEQEQKKAEIRAKLQAAKLKRAREFRENELDMELD